MSTFVPTGNGFVNLQRISSVERSTDGRYILIEDNAPLDTNNPTFDEIITSVISPQGEWECLTTCQEDDGSESIVAEPVLAWGLTVLGQLRPIVPSTMDGSVVGYTLRRVGQTTIYSRNGEFKDEAEWLKFSKENR